jgi:hypothetical protein
MPAIFELVPLGLPASLRIMGFWISSVIALLLAVLSAPPIAKLHGMALPPSEILVLLAAAFAAAGLLSRGRRSRVTD